MNHTPGPWIIFRDKDMPVAILPAGRPGEICQFTTLGAMEETEANARLIAKAPKLIAYLKAIMMDLPITRDWLDPEIERMAKEVIAEIEGG